ncbi:unnamed protein product [Rotaria socialis]
MFITDSIMLATKEAVPTPTPTSKIYALSEASKRLITLKHQAYRRWKRTGDNTGKPFFDNTVCCFVYPGRALRRPYTVKYGPYTTVNRRIWPYYMAPYYDRKSPCRNTVKYDQQRP